MSRRSQAFNVAARARGLSPARRFSPGSAVCVLCDLGPFNLNTERTEYLRGLCVEALLITEDTARQSRNQKAPQKFVQGANIFQVSSTEALQRKASRKEGKTGATVRAGRLRPQATDAGESCRKNRGLPF